MSEERMLSIKKRMEWLNMQLIHESWWDGYSAKGFKTELSKLITELQELEKSIESND